MINIPISITVPYLWGTKEFNKTEWGPINILVGPNGSGKSVFSESLKDALVEHKFKTRLLSAERLTGLEKKSYHYFTNGQALEAGFNISHFEEYKLQGDDYGLSASAFIILKENLDIRIKIEALVSEIFKKRIRLVEQGGFLKPMIQNNNSTSEYDFKSKECHGLKEIITMLTFLYDDKYNCLILDEPELHIHPQFQSFLLSEIQNVAGNPQENSTKKIIFIITHSPYFLDFGKVDDLKNVIKFHPNDIPHYINSLNPQEEYVIRKFLPRFNTYHKQFFFSPNPVFVEGYTDQQIITLLLDKLDFKIAASGSSVIDVGGKDELAIFFKLCKKLKIEARIIADLDAMFSGKLREYLQKDPDCQKYLHENGIGSDTSQSIGELEKRIKSFADELVKTTSTVPELIEIIDFLKPIISNSEKRESVIRSTLVAIIKHQAIFLQDISHNISSNISFILGRYNSLLRAFETANVFIFPKGEIEHYYTQTALNYLNFTANDKNAGFHNEREYILNSDDKTELLNQYNDLLTTLYKSVPQTKININKYIKFRLIEWIQVVQLCICKGEVTDLETLKNHPSVDYKLYNQVLDVTEISIGEDRKFQCKVQINKKLTTSNEEITFCEQTIPHTFNY